MSTPQWWKIVLSGKTPKIQQSILLHSNLDYAWHLVKTRFFLLPKKEIGYEPFRVFSCTISIQLSFQTTTKSCWQPEMSGWIEATMQQNTIFLILEALLDPQVGTGLEDKIRIILHTFSYPIVIYPCRLLRLRGARVSHGS